MPRCFSESNPGVLAAEAEGSGGRDGGDENGDGAQERNENVAHGRSAVSSSLKPRQEILNSWRDALWCDKREGGE